jgi:putative peptide zinc metalloprotease protein
MTVELALAALAVFAWWFSEPGLLNALCLRVMFLCSLSTLVFNGNPLLRYDGYFLLSDWCETPNLGQRADAAVRHLAARWFLGSDATDPAVYPEPRRGWLALYALASWAYRLVILIAILWFCHAVLQPLGLQVLVQLLTVMTLAGLVVVPIWRATRYWGVPGRSQMVNKRRAAVALVAIAVGLAATFAVPLPHRIAVPAAVQPKNARRVYVPVAGRLTWAVDSGAAVRRGDVLGRLENPDLEIELARLRGQREVLRSRLQSVKSRSAVQASRGIREAGSELPAAEQALADIEQRLQQRQQEYQRLTLTAPVAGTVLPPRRRTESNATGELSYWLGQPLDEANRGAFLDRGTLFCVVGDPSQLELLLVIDQAKIGFVQIEQQVRFKTAQLPGRVLTGRIEELSQIDADAALPELVATGVLPVLTEPDGRRRLADVFYQARVTLDPHDARLLPGATGRAQIHAVPLSLGRRLVRYLSGTFRFGM